MKSIVALAMFIACLAQVHSGCVKNLPCYHNNHVGVHYEHPFLYNGLRNNVYKFPNVNVSPYIRRSGCGDCGTCSNCKTVVSHGCGDCGSCSTCKKVAVHGCGGCNVCKQVHPGHAVYSPLFHY